jgi:hypothetical protein
MVEEPMALIDAERDDEALLAAEDQAIAEAANPKTPETVDDIAALIERLTSDETPVHEG